MNNTNVIGTAFLILVVWMVFSVLAGSTAQELAQLVF